MGRKRVSPFGEGKMFASQVEAESSDGIESDVQAQLATLSSIIGNLSEEDGKMVFGMMEEFIILGITPEIYTAFYGFHHQLKSLMEDPELKEIMAQDAEIERERNRPSKPEGLAEGDDKRRLLKIQMKGVTKPPMWREVEVPGDMTFLDLHKVIQEVMGLQDCHLWQFNKEAYREDIQIGIPMDEKDPWGFGVEYVTDDAAQTPVVKYLSKEGDKLEYIYDFGDDWIFTVTVKKVLDSEGPRRPPVCKAYKSELNAMEDVGGPFAYEDMREDLLKWDSYKPKQKKEMAESQNFDSGADYIDFLRGSLFDLADTNDYLATM